MTIRTELENIITKLKEENENHYKEINRNKLRILRIEKVLYIEKFDDDKMEGFGALFG